MLEASSLTNKFKLAGKDGLIFGISSSLKRLIGFLLIPIYTRILTPVEYGILELLNVSTSIFVFIFIIGLDQAFLRFFHDYNEDKRKSLYTTVLVIIAISVSILMIIGFIFNENVSLLLFDTSEYSSHIIITISISAGLLLIKIPKMLLRVQRQSLFFAITEIISFTFTILLILYFVLIRNLNVKGILLGNCIVVLITAIVLLVMRHNDLSKILLPWSEIKGMLKYGMPYILVGIASFIFTYIDRYMIKYMIGLHETGLYSLGFKFGFMMEILLITPVKMVWGPMFLSQKKDSNAKTLYSKFFTYIWFVGAIFFLFISILSKELIELIADRSYWNAYKIVPIISLAYLVWTLRIVLEVGVILNKKTYLIALYFLIGAVTNILLNLFLIPRFGIAGASFATLGAFTFMIITDYFINRRLMKINYEWFRILKIIIITTIVFFVASSVDNYFENKILSLIFKFLLIMSSITIYFIIGFFNQHEKKAIKKLFRIR